MCVRVCVRERERERTVLDEDLAVRIVVVRRFVNFGVRFELLFCHSLEEPTARGSQFLVCRHLTRKRRRARVQQAVERDDGLDVLPVSYLQRKTCTLIVLWTNVKLKDLHKLTIDTTGVE